MGKARGECLKQRGQYVQWLIAGKSSHLKNKTKQLKKKQDNMEIGEQTVHGIWHECDEMGRVILHKVL